MKTSKLELSGQKFGHISVVSRSLNPRTWLGYCDCQPDTLKSFNGSRLASGKITHCGCLKVNHMHTAGGKPSPTYVAWRDMLKRCNDAKFIGADGITKYPRQYASSWKDFTGFLKDMGVRPPGTTLDRINTVDGRYIKSNCRWATREQQDFNKSNNVLYFVEPDDMTKAGSALDWAEYFTKRLGVPMTVDEFKTIMKFFTVRQLWCGIHPSARTPSELREQQDRDKWQAEVDRAREQLRQVQREDGYCEPEPPEDLGITTMADACTKLTGYDFEGEPPDTGQD